jgi:hypothetical protein
MQTFTTLVGLLAGSDADIDTPLGHSRRLFLGVTAALSSIAFAALWGLAAGGVHAANAFTNLVSVPMLLLVSGLASLPAIVLLWKLAGTGGARARDLMVAYAVALFGGTLVLAVLAPLVALYQHSSSWFGPVVASGSCIVAFVTGAALLVRVLWRLTGGAIAKRALVLPVLGIFVLQGASLAQLASIVPPLMETRTPFGRGIDALRPGAQRTHESPEGQP